MIADFRAKKKGFEADSGHMQDHPAEMVIRAFDFFNSKFIWESGEYLMKVDITASNEVANITKNYRFTIFETHTEQLKVITEHYKLGGGIWWNPEKVQTNVILPISEA